MASKGQFTLAGYLSTQTQTSQTGDYNESRVTLLTCPTYSNTLAILQLVTAQVLTVIRKNTLLHTSAGIFWPLIPY